MLLDHQQEQAKDKKAADEARKKWEATDKALKSLEKDEKE